MKTIFGQHVDAAACYCRRPLWTGALSKIWPTLNNGSEERAKLWKSTLWLYKQCRTMSNPSTIPVPVRQPLRAIQHLPRNHQSTARLTFSIESLCLLLLLVLANIRLTETLLSNKNRGAPSLLTLQVASQKNKKKSRLRRTRSRNV